MIPISASADTGPKASVNITFESAEALGESFYVTLLAAEEGRGPWYMVEGASPSYEYGIDDEIFDKFKAFSEGDDFYLWPYIKECTESFVFGYYPPTTFKILVYSPESDKFAISNIYERYAFHSYYTVSLENFSEISVSSHADLTEEKLLTAEKSYDHSNEIKGLIARLIITVAIEVFLAYLFGYKNASSISVILIANLLTQIFLNLYLNYDIYLHGNSFTYRLGGYLFIELVILVAEGALYAFTIAKQSEKPSKKRALIYAAVANALSFIIGIYLAVKIPTLF
jgi:hypothetical protein